jgi:glutathione S-transferase
MDPIIAVFTLAVILFYFWTSFGVAKARGVSEIKAPAMTGHPQLERAVRVHYNMLEWLPIFLPTLWLFAYFVPAPYGRWGALALGIVWVVGRILYQNGYMADPSKRSQGFMIQALACIGLMLGAFGGAIWALTQGG